MSAIHLTTEFHKNSNEIARLTARNSELQLEYLRNITPNIKLDFVSKIHKYLKNNNFTNYDIFLQKCRQHITAGPTGDQVIYTNPYNQNSRYDTIFYEWDNEGIMYVRADPNCDTPVTDCYNGFAFNENLHNTILPYWFTRTLPTFEITPAIENAIGKFTAIGYPPEYRFSNNEKDLAVRLTHIPEKYWLIVVAFDLSQHYHYCIGEEIIKNNFHHRINI